MQESVAMVARMAVAVLATVEARARPRGPAGPTVESRVVTPGAAFAMVGARDHLRFPTVSEVLLGTIEETRVLVAEEMWAAEEMRAAEEMSALAAEEVKVSVEDGARVVMHEVGQAVEFEAARSVLTGEASVGSRVELKVVVIWRVVAGVATAVTQGPAL